MRYIVTDGRGVSLAEIEQALKSLDPAYSIAGDELKYGDELFGEIDVSPLEGGEPDEEIEELLEDVEDSAGINKDRVIETLKNATAVVALRVLWRGRDTEQTLNRIDLLWEWLHRNRAGLMQADGEGYYDRSGQVLKVR